MLTEHHKFIPPDRNKRNNFCFEVNWNLDDPESNESKIVKITCMDGKASFVKREDLHQFLFAIGTLEEKKKMMPMTVVPVHNTTLEFELTAKKDIKKGEKIRCIRSVSIECPLYQQEVVGEVKKEAKSKKVFLTG